MHEGASGRFCMIWYTLGGRYAPWLAQRRRKEAGVPPEVHEADKALSWSLKVGAAPNRFNWFQPDGP